MTISDCKECRWYTESSMEHFGRILVMCACPIAPRYYIDDGSWCSMFMEKPMKK